MGWFPFPFESWQAQDLSQTDLCMNPESANPSLCDLGHCNLMSVQ